MRWILPAAFLVGGAYLFWLAVQASHPLLYFAAAVCLGMAYAAAQRARRGGDGDDPGGRGGGRS